MRYLVESNRANTTSEIRDCLEKEFSCHGEYSFDVKLFNSIPEVPVVETGVLMSPMEICKCNNVVAIDFRNNDGGQCYLSKANQSVGIGKRLVISEHMYPREFYRDIQKTFDFSAIKEGDLIWFEMNNGVWGIGFLRLCNNPDVIVVQHGDDEQEDYYRPNKNGIKSIRIIELARDEK